MVDEDRAQDNRLQWHDDMPYSTVFGDHYYSKADGRAECDHVFLKGNDLPVRWKDKDHFTIAELGFGTGLNFVETWRQWRAHCGSGGRLSFVSFERFPLAATEIAKALNAWPELSTFTRALVDAWPPLPGGCITIELGDAVRLDVYIGDANDTLQQWSGSADAWFLDGFAPSRNKRMWSQELMRAVFEHTVTGGTFATYTAAGWVRRNLSETGFDVRKVPGFAGKRDMTRGTRPR